MTASIRKLIAGNWKMNGLSDALGEAEALSKALIEDPARCRVALCPPATLIERMVRELTGGPVEIGAQDFRILMALQPDAQRGVAGQERFALLLKARQRDQHGAFRQGGIVGHGGIGVFDKSAAFQELAHAAAVS